MSGSTGTSRKKKGGGGQSDWAAQSPLSPLTSNNIVRGSRFAPIKLPLTHEILCFYPGWCKTSSIELESKDQMVDDGSKRSGNESATCLFK